MDEDVTDVGIPGKDSVKTVERTVDGKHLGYVTVGLGLGPRRNRRDLRELSVLLDKAIGQIIRAQVHIKGCNIGNPIAEPRVIGP